MNKYFFIITNTLLILFLLSCTGSKKNASGFVMDKNWILKEFNGKPVTVTGTREPFIIFHKKDQRVNGNAGCNNFFGSYKIEGSQVSISNVGATKMACQDMQLENDFFRLLQTPLQFSINGNEMIFKNSNGNTMARFENATN